MSITLVHKRSCFHYTILLHQPRAFYTYNMMCTKIKEKKYCRLHLHDIVHHISHVVKENMSLTSVMQSRKTAEGSDVQTEGPACCTLLDLS